MNTLTLFPELLNFSFFAPALLRVSVALLLFYLGKERLKKQYNWMSIIYFASAVSVFLGVYTQVGAVLGIVSLKFDLYFDYFKNRKITPVTMEKYFLYGIAGIILLTLIVTGPGIWAFDLPL